MSVPSTHSNCRSEEVWCCGCSLEAVGITWASFSRAYWIAEEAQSLLWLTYLNVLLLTYSSLPSLQHFCIMHIHLSQLISNVSLIIVFQAFAFSTTINNTDREPSSTVSEFRTKHFIGPRTRPTVNAVHSLAFSSLSMSLTVTVVGPNNHDRSHIGGLLHQLDCHLHPSRN